jgi:hypothetical protein
MREKAVVTLHPCGGSGIQRCKYQSHAYRQRPGEYDMAAPKTILLQGTTKSNTAPRNQSSDGVKTVTRSTFNDWVLSVVTVAAKKETAGARK